MTGIALYGAAEHNAADLPGVYRGNLCGLRTTQATGAGGQVVRPLCIPGTAYEQAFVSPVNGPLQVTAHIRQPVSGSAAALVVLIDSAEAGVLDLLTLEADTPTPVPLGPATVKQGETVITVRTACAGDVVPGKDLELTITSQGA